MASGLPDYIKDFRTRYGAASVAEGLEDLNPAELKRIVRVEGKGIIYGGYLVSEGTRSQNLDVPSLFIDGTIIAETSFFLMDKYTFNTAKIVPFYLKKYDDVAWVYSVGLSSGYTFENSFEVAYKENEGGTPRVISKANYALI